MNNLNPQIADQLVYVAHSTVTSDRLHLTAANDTAAKVALIDKLGYTIVRDSRSTGDNHFVLVDADDPSILEAALKSTTFEAALDEVLAAAKWELNEPQEMLGGSMGSGFGLEEQHG